MKLRAIDHVQITVLPSDEEETVCFYREILGLLEIDKPEPLQKNGGAWFRLGGVELHVSVEEAAGDNGRSKRHVCFEVESLADAEAVLSEAGVDIIPDNQPIAEWARFYVRDPGGNRIELAERCLHSGT